MQRRENSNSIEKKMKKVPVVITKNLDDSFKRNPII